MQRLLEDLLYPRVSSNSEDKSFAILPQQSQRELVLSSVHSKLDRVLLFLQREVGYVLLDDARPRRGGGVQLGLPPQRSSIRRRSTRIPKGEPLVEEEEAKQVIRFTPDTAKYAQYPDDLVLVWRFASILAEANPASACTVQQETLYKTVLQGIRLMHLCSYDYSDLVLTLAYASVYYKTTCNAIGHTMSDTEAAHVCALLIFLAHSFVIDETCPLRYWQQYIFKKYCTLKVLDAALFRVFQMRDFKLRISKEDERHALSVLLCSAKSLDVILSNAGDHFYDGHIEAIKSGDSSTCTTATSSREHRDETPRSAVATAVALAGESPAASEGIKGHSVRP